MHLDAARARARILYGTPATRYLTVTIMAPRQPPLREASGVNVTLALGRRDQFAVLVYGDRAEIVGELSAASFAATWIALDDLADIDALGWTELTGPWFSGARALAAPHAAAGASVLTDGLTKARLTDRNELAMAAASFRKRGSTSTFGIGANFDEELPASMAIAVGRFVETGAPVPDVLANETRETLEVVARDALLDIVCGPGVNAVVLNDNPIEKSVGRLRVRLGDVVGNEEITLALAIICAPAVAEQIASVDFRLTNRDGAVFHEPMRVQWRVGDAASTQWQPVAAISPKRVAC